MANTQEIDFEDLEPIQVPVKVRKDRYILREASSDAAIKYRNKMLKSMKMDDGKISSADGLADAEPLVVSLCLHPVDLKTGLVMVNPQTNIPLNVPEAVVRSWPNRVQSTLFDRLMEISPNLQTKPTKDSLLKQRADIDRKLSELGKEEELTKKLSASMEDTTDSPMNSD